MEAVLSLDFLEKLETKLGKDVARDIILLYDSTVKALEEKTIDLAVQKKLELKDELTKELATKADIALVRSELHQEIEKVRADVTLVKTDLEAQIKDIRVRLNFLIILMLIFIGFLNPVVTKLISNWLKLGL